MTHFPINYMQAEREETGFSHADLSFLIGQKSSSAIGHYELGDRVPTFETALALALIFGKHPYKLFESFYHHVEETVVARALALYETLEGKTDPLSCAKRTALEAIPKRAVGNPEGL